MNLFQASIRELRQALLAGELTAEQLVRAHIERIREFDPWVRAFTWTRFDEAIEEARAQDREFQQWQADGESGAAAQGGGSSRPRLSAERSLTAEREFPPLWGMPCSLKNCFALEGAPWVGGALHRRDVRAENTAPAVARLQAAGAIVLGLTNVPEALTWFETDNRVHGRTENPRRLGTSPGGSTGGEAAALAYGGVVFGLGTDLGSSIRLPAALCGIAGLKTSPRRVPGEGVWPQPEGKVADYSVVGPMARSSEDLALLLQVLEGSTAAVESLARPRFVVLEGPAEFRLAPAIPLALQSVVQGLEARGFQTERFSHPGLRRGARLWLARMGVAQDQPGMRRFQEILKDGAPVRLTTEWARTLLGKGRHTVPVLALASFENGMRRFQSVFEKDLALASELEQVLTERLRDDGVLLLPAFARTRMRHHEAKLRPFHFGQGGVFNVLEMPAVVVPVGVAEDGSPVALQVVAARGRDELAIRAAGEIERKLPPAQGGWR